MKRLLTYVLLGPPIGLVGVLIWSWVAADRYMPKAFLPAPELYGAMMLFTYVFGFIPASAVATVDWYVVQKLKSWKRIGVTALAGYAVTFLFAVMSAPDVWGKAFLSALMIGVPPATICALILGDKQNGKAQ